MLNRSPRSQRKMKDQLRKRLRDSLTVTVDAEKIAELIQLMKARGIINSRRELGRRINLASTTLDALCNSPGEVDSRLSTIRAISAFILKSMPDLYEADSDQLVDDLLGDDAPLRRDLKQAVRGE